MTAENWEQVKQIVDECLRLAPEEREAHIAEAAGGNAAVAAEAASLIAAASDAGEFLETPAMVLEDLSPGEEVGPYRILDLIGRGGMGSVYRAVRTSDFQQKVAVKVVKRGMDTQFLLERFRQERQILATLDHPNIARLLDGGATADGRPYIVMELVEGQPITEYAMAHKLSDEGKLRLFLTVCSAIQHAHQKLVVHRDLKAGNILVTEQGVPKLLDFGIAKLLEPDTRQTATAIRMMTPECASPEQVRGEPLTTLTDVYSLGVLLYELLTGTNPHRFANSTLAEMQRVICNEEPAKPSTVRPIAAELDNIILKALDKDPARRYVSAAQMLEDIDRFLAGLPVIARPSTLGYRASKFVRRHLAATLGGAVVVIALAAGLGTALWQARVAGLERERAERRFAQTHQLARSLLFEIHDGIKDLPGSTAVRKLIVERSLKYLDLLVREKTGDAALEEDLAAAYVRVADVQGGANYANLGDSAGALASYEKARQIRESLVTAHPGDLGAERRLGEVYRRIANQYLWFVNIGEAAQVIRKLIKLDEKITSNPQHLPEDELRHGADYELAGDMLSGNGTSGSLDDDAGALENHRKALAIMSANAKNSDTPLARHMRAVAESKIATDLTRLGEQEEAGRLFRKIQPVFEELAASGNAMARVHVAVIEGRAGDNLLMAGDAAAALVEYGKALEFWKTELAKDPKNASLRLGAAGAYGAYGFALLRSGDGGSGRWAAGMENLRTSERMLRQELASDPHNVMVQATMAMLVVWFAEGHRLGGDPVHALARAMEAVELYGALAKAQPRDVSAQLNLAASKNLLGEIWLGQGDLERARQAFGEALAVAEPSPGSAERGKSVSAKYVAADALAGMSGASSKAEAHQWLERSAAVWKSIAHPRLLSPNGFPTAGPAGLRRGQK